MNSAKFLLSTAVVLTGILALTVLVPLTTSPGGGYRTCGPSRCIDVVQYESVSYAYGGWGGIFQSGVNIYSLNGWSCYCPASAVSNATPCCVPPFAYVLWPVLGLVLVADLGCLVAIFLSNKRKQAGLSVTSHEGTTET